MISWIPVNENVFIPLLGVSSQLSGKLGPSRNYVSLPETADHTGRFTSSGAVKATVFELYDSPTPDDGISAESRGSAKEIHSADVADVS